MVSLFYAVFKPILVEAWTWFVIYFIYNFVTTFFVATINIIDKVSIGEWKDVQVREIL